LSVAPPRRRHEIHEVLLVDPDRDVRAALALYLQLRNVRVIGTGTTSDTLQCLREGFRPCVVVTDPRAAGVAGWPLVDYLRTDSVLASVPLILTSSDAMQVRCAHWRGVRECIRKPASPASFLDAIERRCVRRYVAPRGLPPAAPI
jgi:DNA-binding NtrC family response regulator